MLGVPSRNHLILPLPLVVSIGADGRTGQGDVRRIALPVRGVGRTNSNFRCPQRLSREPKRIVDPSDLQARPPRYLLRPRMPIPRIADGDPIEGVVLPLMLAPPLRSEQRARQCTQPSAIFFVR